MRLNIRQQKILLALDDGKEYTTSTIADKVYGISWRNFDDEAYQSKMMRDIYTVLYGFEKKGIVERVKPVGKRMVWRKRTTSEFNLTFAQAMTLVENGATVVCENDPYKQYKYFDNNLMIRYPHGWTPACLFG